MNSESGAKEKFHAIGEAYTVLGNERQRRAYDRSLIESSRHASSSSSYASTSQNYEWGYDTRRRSGAKYAWENPRHQRPPSGSAFRGSQQYPHTKQSSSSAGRSYTRPESTFDPWASPDVRRSTGYSAKQAREEMERRDEERRIASVSPFWRTVQVIGILAIVGAVSGGWTVNAG